jgi:putative transposase
MPRGLKRYYGAHDLHFITCSCYRRFPLLGTANRRDLLLNLLEEVRQRHRFVVLGYVVMPEHFHLLISESQETTPSIAMQVLKQRFAHQVLAQLRTQRSASPGAAGEIWQRRFYDFNVWTEHKRIEKLRYMHRNPVKRGLVIQPDQWAWSSFRSYAFGEAGPVRINDCQVLELKIRPPAA